MSARRSRRYAIADLFACDVADISTYQPGRTRVPVYTAGSDYFVALRRGEQPPDDVAATWTDVGDSHGYRVMRSAS